MPTPAPCYGLKFDAIPMDTSFTLLWAGLRRALLPGPGFFLYSAPSWTAPFSAWSTGYNIFQGLSLPASPPPRLQPSPPPRSRRPSPGPVAADGRSGSCRHGCAWLPAGVGTGAVRMGACEDPSLWICPRTGAFHVLAHCYSTIAWNGTDAAANYCAFTAGQLLHKRSAVVF